LTQDNTIMPDESHAEVSAETDTQTLNKIIEEAKAESEKNLAGWKRTQADLENLKKRFEQERSDIIAFGNSSLWKKLLPVIDDFDRAFGSLPPDIADNTWAKGIELIYQKLQGVMAAEGLRMIETTGKHFDPKLHDAYCQQEGPEGIVITEVEKGYLYKGEVLRPAKVTVGNGIENSGLKCDTDTDLTE